MWLAARRCNSPSQLLVAKSLRASSGTIRASYGSELSVIDLLEHSHKGSSPSSPTLRHASRCKHCALDPDRRFRRSRSASVFRPHLGLLRISLVCVTFTSQTLAPSPRHLRAETATHDGRSVCVTVDLTTNEVGGGTACALRQCEGNRPKSGILSEWK